jgi:two-component system chemotaxis response regulator CheB
MPSENRKIRVLVVDDSALMRKLISNLLAKDPELEVIATAIDGCFALTKVEQLKPDVVTLDVDMPRMDGLTALAEMVSKHRTPVIMLSSLTTRGAALTMQALEKGALDFVCKPSGAARLPEMAEELVSKIKAAARTNVLALVAPHPPVRKKALVASRAGAGRVIGSGPVGRPACAAPLLPRIPADIDAGIVIVQHMPESFTAMLAHWLNEICDLEVKEAEPGDLALPGRVLIAPGSLHMKVRRTPAGCEVLLEGGEPVNGHKPSVDVLFRSVAQEFGALATGIIMTGMGSDGAHGLGEIMTAGGHTLAQDKESCAVYGMPRVAVERGYANKIVPLYEMAPYLRFGVGRLAYWRRAMLEGNRETLGDRSPLTCLIVDDSALCGFTRRMMDSFDNVIASEAANGNEASEGIRPAQTRHRADGHCHAGPRGSGDGEEDMQRRSQSKGHYD